MKLFCLRQQTGSNLLVGFLCLNIPPFLFFGNRDRVTDIAIAIAERVITIQGAIQKRGYETMHLQNESSKDILRATTFATAELKEPKLKYWKEKSYHTKHYAFWVHQ